MQKAFENYIREKKLVTSNETVLVAVSGGIDSMVMLDLFQKSDKFNLVVAHCNFMLRGEESNKDELFIQGYCKENKLDLFVKSFDTTAFANEKGISIQMAARDLRYTWFEELAQENSISKIALAQHLDDQVETFFINLIRGTGISGIHGILPINGNLIRPLLFADRKMILQYQIENNIPFREDESNNSDKYLRNFIRHNISPQFEQLSPQFAFKLDENIARFKEVEDFYKTTIHNNLKQLSTEKNHQLFIDIEKLNSLEYPELHIREMLTEKGFNTDTINKVYQLLSQPISGKYFNSETHELLFNRNQIIIRKKQNKNQEEYLINIGENITNPFNISLEQIDNNLNSYKGKPNIAFLDFDKLIFPLKLRKWKKSDSFIPFGMTGRKKLSDFFIDKKLSNFEKEDIWILESGDEIVWILGHRTDNRYRITKNTKHIYKITFDNGNN
jgi:tRNA(Ile)-lysidine synthase